MRFCDSCGEKTIRKKEENGDVQLYCRSCNKSFSVKPESVILTVERTKDRHSIKIKSKSDIQTLPIEKEKCPKCGNEEAYSWQRQTRSGDEPATRFYRCVKCNKTWREYS
tara:strand:+ start:232 stop:561 length:330 start_codon:yes stop_codon:yes gene_type:complete